MRGSRFVKWGTAALAAALVAIGVPAMATESSDTQPEEPVVLSEAEVNSNIQEDFGEGNNQSQEVISDMVVTLDDGETGNGGNTAPGPVVEGVVVSPASATLNVVGQTTQLTATVSLNEAEYESIEWSSSNTSIAKVDGNGLVTAGSTGGTATITATVTYTVEADDGEEETCTEDAACSVKVSLYNGLYQDPTGSDWYYYKNGAVDTSKTAVIQGTVNDTSGYWNVVKGKVSREATVVKYDGTWWYFNNNGKMDKSYTGFAKNSNGSWYCENGKVTFNKNDVLKDTTGAIGTKGTWYYVVGSKVQTSYTGVANYKNSNGWWYIKNGQVDFTANTIAKNNNGWWYVEGGKVNFNYNGFGSNSNGKWYCENGKVTFNKNSVIKDTTGAIGTKGNWYYVVGSKVQTNFTGLANYKNSNGWWYIKNGVVDFTHNGVDKNKNGWWYVVDGKVQFGFTGLANYKNENGWWYIKNGKVDFSASGVYKNKNGWWYVSGGKVKFSFNGIASNSNGMWVIENGKVNFNYNGTYTYQGVSYSVTDGKASLPLGMDYNMYTKAQSQSSSTKWLIMVDVTNCKLGIFQGSKGNWVPVKYWDCTTGASGSQTCIGSYTIYGKGRAFGDDDHTCYWYSQFNGNYLIHSILYYPGTYNVKDGRLGMHLSNGCVRLSIDNAKWVYDNVPYSTRVRTYK